MSGQHYDVEVFDEYEQFRCVIQVEAPDREDAWIQAYREVCRNPGAQSWARCPDKHTPDFDGFHRGEVKETEAR